MKKQLSLAMGLVLAGMATAPVMADDHGMGLEFSANVAMTSDYVFRGISQNEEDAAIQGGFDVAHTSGVYAGVWGSNVSEDLFTDASMEMDLYVGWSGETGPVSLDVGYLRYMYPGAASGTEYDTDEYHLGVSGDLGPVSAGITYNYSPDFFGFDDADYWDISASIPVGQFTLAAHYGMTDYDDDAQGADYDDWSIGASTEFGGFGFDLSYYDTDAGIGECAGVTVADCDDRVVFTVSKAL